MQSARPGVAFLIDPASPHRAYMPARQRTWRPGAPFAVLLVIALAVASLAAGDTGLADICGQGDGIACGP